MGYVNTVMQYFEEKRTDHHNSNQYEVEHWFWTYATTDISLNIDLSFA